VALQTPFHSAKFLSVFDATEMAALTMMVATLIVTTATIAPPACFFWRAWSFCVPGAFFGVSLPSAALVPEKLDVFEGGTTAATATSWGMGDAAQRAEAAMKERASVENCIVVDVVDGG
jgi:hypothetical protein